MTEQHRQAFEEGGKYYSSATCQGDLRTAKEQISEALQQIAYAQAELTTGKDKPSVTTWDIEVAARRLTDACAGIARAVETLLDHDHTSDG